MGCTVANRRAAGAFCAHRAGGPSFFNPLAGWSSSLQHPVASVWLGRSCRGLRRSTFLAPGEYRATLKETGAEYPAWYAGRGLHFESVLKCKGATAPQAPFRPAVSSFSCAFSCLDTPFMRFHARGRVRPRRAMCMACNRATPEQRGLS